MEKLTCANVKPLAAKYCTNEGTSVCSACKLVMYCSKKCQQEHWSIHKRDCKDPIRSPEWQPLWVKEGRSPMFMSGDALDPDWHQKLDFIAMSRHLWGNVPAYDLLNTPQNENDLNRDFNICIPGDSSGDLRHILMTISNLPLNYSHKLTVLLNDREEYIFIRNISLLLILGSTAISTTHAANIALHFWYSAFLPMEYSAFLANRYVVFMTEEVKKGRFCVSLGHRATISGEMPTRALILMALTCDSKYSEEDTAREINRVRFEPSRVDRHHRRYGRLEPSHRLASLEFRRFGLVLPFGARNDRFNTPNRYLFSPEGQWLQDDLADPLESWNVADVLAAGQKYGVPRADLYGCLYFYLRDQLRSFAERLRTFDVSFHIFNFDASDLATRITSNSLSDHGIPPSIRFDRIDVSNIVDFEYLGIPRVLSDWEPFLALTKDATLIAYFMNWVNRQKGGDINSVDRNVIASIASKMLKAGRVSAYTLCMMTYHDNSKAFQQYLDSHGMPETLQKLSLKRKARHTIVPHRIGIPLDSPPDALPAVVFHDAESWYNNVSPWCIYTGCRCLHSIRLYSRSPSVTPYGLSASLRLAGSCTSKISSSSIYCSLSCIKASAAAFSFNRH
ncbi:hypothetical protein BXZ70DRAFT_899118 [Cristinia sonorae]|uniref:MYND-type domain-containing protein n=1 Tax=Cristinia sonorae TaxID=1940300 RepID=A0A8K0XM07_9AGAR|nr:hypothetical protein BXZ70DRAFT_899118 [Cristinia sonorae]